MGQQVFFGTLFICDTICTFCTDKGGEEDCSDVLWVKGEYLRTCEGGSG